MSTLHTQDVIKASGVAFGTSGARGLVTQFSDEVCAAFTLAFVASLEGKFEFKEVAIAIDNRPSSYKMAQACSAALQAVGIKPIYYGVLPTPALAFTAMQKNIPCIMVTGSHIPFDRNGLKFYRPDGEISKQDEQAIITNPASFTALSQLPELVVDKAAAKAYVARYVDLFEQPILVGKHIGIYEHSSAGRDLYKPLFEQLGATVTSLEPSETFVPIDTEAVSEQDKQKALNWSKHYAFDAIFSTDGDGDRPLIADENGHWLRGDILGLLCAKELGIAALAIPVSCNTSVELSQAFKQVERTQIGSPYVIAAFAPLNQQFTSVAGFEANGGFLLGSDTVINNHLLKALPTRDAVLPALMLLAASIKKGSISALVTEVSQRFSASDRIKDFATEKSQGLINQHKNDPSELIRLLGFDEAAIDWDSTDGLRISLANNDIIHLRPSGNAPELRCYAESSDEPSAQALVSKVLAKVITL
jgi:phosphomannomutase